jgi:hypothetical protein
MKGRMGSNGKSGAELRHTSVEDLKLFELEKSPIINVEINLELIPLFLYKTRRRSEESLEATNVIRTPDGQRLEQYVKVVGGREYGIPGPVDRDVHVGIMKLVHRAGGMPPDGVVSFSLYELLKILGKNRGGNNYAEVPRDPGPIIQFRIPQDPRHRLLLFPQEPDGEEPLPARGRQEAWQALLDGGRTAVAPTHTHARELPLRLEDPGKGRTRAQGTEAARVSGAIRL